jgi:hypothetical protein
MVGVDARTTMDMDATIKGKTLTAPEISSVVGKILRTPIDDGVELTLQGVEEIREEADYPGFRVSIAAVLDKTRQTLKVDITTGDYVTPKEIEYSFRLMFEDRTISILAYNLETVLSEKFETLVTRGVTNTRMRDFYDIYILTSTQTFDAEIFRSALRKTVEKRGTSEQIEDMYEAIAMVEESSVMIDLWERYRKKYTYANDVTWEMVMEAVKGLARLTGE